MNVIDRLREEARRRGQRTLLDTSELHVARDEAGEVLEGSVDDAFAKATLEAIARDMFGARLRTRIAVRDDLAAEAAPKETEFGTEEAARAATTTIPRPS